jgi:hypothetical protein
MGTSMAMPGLVIPSLATVSANVRLTMVKFNMGMSDTDY